MFVTMILIAFAMRVSLWMSSLAHLAWRSKHRLHMLFRAVDAAVTSSAQLVYSTKALQRRMKKDRYPTESGDTMTYGSREKNTNTGCFFLAMEQFLSIFLTAWLFCATRNIKSITADFYSPL